MLALAAGAALRAVWENELGGITFAVGEGAGARFVKWAPVASGIDLPREAQRMRWAVQYTSVPRVIEIGSDALGSWLVTAALPGETAVAERWKASPRLAVTALGRGLRALHDALPVVACPFDWSVGSRLEDIHRRATLSLHDQARWHPVHRHLSVARAIAMLSDAPPVDRLVVCHGDACSPNTLLGDGGEVTGHVDLGALGVADRWADLAVATWATQWNYGDGWEDRLLEAYGVAPDPERTAYYRLLWDLGP